MEQQIKNLEERVQQLEDIVKSIVGVEMMQLTTKNKLYARGNGIRLTSYFNPLGCEIRTGAAINAAGIINEIGSDVPNGSLYLSSATGQPFFVKYNGTWTLVNLP